MNDGNEPASKQPHSLPWREKELLTSAEVGAIMGKSTKTVATLIRSGRLPAVNVSCGKQARWSIRRCDLDEFLTPPILRKKRQQQRR